jgi:hypothetical protein
MERLEWAGRIHAGPLDCLPEFAMHFSPLHAS